MSANEAADLTSATIRTEIIAALRDLLVARHDLGDRFTDTDSNWGMKRKLGPFASMQGLRTVAGIITAIPDVESASITGDFDSLLKEWATILPEGEPSALFAVAPQPMQQNNVEALLESTKRMVWTDSTSWALSTAVALNYVFRTNRTLAARCQPYVDRTRAAIVASLKELLAVQLDNGGWSWGLTTASDAHLYFTSSVLQSYADVFDYIFGESDEQIQIGRDTETCGYLEVRLPQVESLLNESRKRAADFLAKTYLPAAVEGRLSYAQLATDTIKVTTPKDDVLQVPLLYCYSYLLEALILTGYDQRNASSSAQVTKLRELLAQRAAPILANPTDELDALCSTLLIEVEVNEQGKKTLVQLRDPSLWAQLLRTAVLYAYYVDWTGVADPLIIDSEGAYAKVLRDRRDTEPGKGLWDTEAFNLSVTCRAIEALIDVYDYIERLSRPGEAIRVAPPTDLGRVIADSIYPYLKPLVQGYVDELRLSAKSAAPESTEVDVKQLKGSLEGWLSANIKAPFDTIGPLAEKRMVDTKIDSFEEVAKLLLGKDAERLQDDEISYSVFKAMAGIAYVTFARCLPQILAETVLQVAKPDERIAIEKRSERLQQPISSSIFDALRGFAEYWSGLPDSEQLNAKTLVVSGLKGSNKPTTSAKK